MPSESADALENLSPSCVLAYRIIDRQGPIPFSTVRDEGYFADSTARDAVETLEEAGLVTTRLGPDARVSFYEADR